jgi:hypothetical protein
MKTSENVQDLAQKTQVQLIEAIINVMSEKKLSESSIKKAKPFIQALAERNSLSEDAAMLFSAFFNDFTDTHILIREIAITIESTFISRLFNTKLKIHNTLDIYIIRF